MKVSVKVPATIANLGCGFDCFGLAIPIHNIITIEETIMPGSGIEINILGDDSQNNLENIPTDKSSIIYKAIELLYSYMGQVPEELKIDIKTSIPVARGLGSSSSVIVGALVAANELLGNPADLSVLLSIATELEGHPDNITPALVGGITMATQEDDGSVVYRKLPWPKEWKLMVCIPDYELSTGISRSVLPNEVDRKDAIFNLRRTAMMVEAIHTKDEELMKLALKDKLHEPYREKLVPTLSLLKENLKHIQGVLGCVLAGAGPSVLIITNGTNQTEIKEVIENTYKESNVTLKLINTPIEEKGAERI
ncbi:MAG: homoserine kinase [Cyanobacteria bacterium SIG30]|nr:homoserine kinase [Cyanobacteria bacterium SIG30]